MIHRKRRNLRFSGQSTIVFLGFLFLFLPRLFSQDFAWANRWGTSASERGRGVIADNSGNSYFTGHFRDSVDIDPGPGVFMLQGAGGILDIYVAKFDPNGSLVWAKSFSGDQSDDAFSIAIDNQESLYITGGFRDTCDFDPGPGVTNLISAGGYDGFVMKLNPLGDLIWVKQLGGTAETSGYEVKVDAFGNVYATGWFNGTVDLDPGISTVSVTSNGFADAFLTKFDSAGNFIWGKQLGGTNDDQGWGIDIDDLGNVAVSGNFQGSVDFDPGPGINSLNSNGGYDVFVTKLDPAGDFLWAGTWGGIGLEQMFDLAMDASGNIYTGGYFTGSMDSDPGPGFSNLVGAGGKDIFISKIDPSGNLIWAKAMGGQSDDVGYGFALDSQGGVYATGRIASNDADFDPGPGMQILNGLLGSGYIVKLDSGGDFAWVTHFQGTGLFEGADIATDYSGNVFATGFFGSTVDFDPGPSSFNLTAQGTAREVFALKLSQCVPTQQTNTVIACSSYLAPWGTAYTSSGVYADSTLNQFGCDSITTIQLTVNNVDTSVSLIAGGLNANAINASFQWLDCDNSFTPILGATGNSFLPAINGNYAVEVIQNGCIDTSACTQVTVVGIQDNGLAGEVLVFPNPTNSKVIVNLKDKSQKVEIRVLNITGQLISQGLFEIEGPVELELPGPIGIYFIQIRGQNGLLKSFKVQKH